MAENLKTSKYNDGTSIPNITDNTQWSNLTIGAWVYYNNDVANNTKYGKLYNWYAVSPLTNDNKNICPVGWHVPSDAEWVLFTDCLSSSFNVIPGGYRINDGRFLYINYYSYLWSIKEIDSNFSWARVVTPSKSSVYDGGSWGKKSGFSVRCIKD